MGGVHNGWISFALLAAATTFAQMFPVKSPQNVVYQTSIVFLFAASLVLRPKLLVLIPLVMTLPEWVRERYPLPIEMSNIANYTLSALAAWGTADDPLPRRHAREPERPIRGCRSRGMRRVRRG